jgi:hypothetical protein
MTRERNAEAESEEVISTIHVVLVCFAVIIDVPIFFTRSIPILLISPSHT